VHNGECLRCGAARGLSGANLKCRLTCMLDCPEHRTTTPKSTTVDARGPPATDAVSVTPHCGGCGGRCASHAPSAPATTDAHGGLLSSETSTLEPASDVFPHTATHSPCCKTGCAPSNANIDAKLTVPSSVAEEARDSTPAVATRPLASIVVVLHQHAKKVLPQKSDLTSASRA
jgi:hypothetical protein